MIRSASENSHEVSHLSEQAAQWVVCLSAKKVSDEQRAAFESWLAQDLRHREVYAQVERLWQSVTPQQRSPRHRVKALLSVVLLLGSAYLLPLSEWLADERTGIGEIRQVSLADGSTLTLDSGSAVDIAFSAHERRVILRSGRLLAEVAPDTAPNKRPFIVENRDGTAQALGTRYVVEQTEHNSVVSVIESRVAVASRAQPDQPVNLQAGQSVRFDSKRVDQPEAASPFTASWTKARLVYQDVPLDQVVADLARYRKGFLKNDEHAAQLRFTGVLPADDPEAALSIIKNALPVRIERHTSWLIWIAMRQP
jgi:transmembrane sensor